MVPDCTVCLTTGKWPYNAFLDDDYPYPVQCDFCPLGGYVYEGGKDNGNGTSGGDAVCELQGSE